MPATASLLSYSLLTGSPASSMRDSELADGLRQLGRLAARVEARRAELVAEADRRGLARREGFGSTTAWLMALSGDPAAICRSRLAVATSLREMPATRAAFAAGEMPESRVRLLAEAREVDPEKFAADEARLVSQTAAASPSRLPRVLAQWRRESAPGGAETDAARLYSRRALHISPSWSGMVHLDGDLDPEGGSIVLAALRSLSEGLSVHSHDSRTPPQCRADALVEICRRHLDRADAPSRRRPHLIVTVPWETLRAAAGPVELEGGPVDAATVRRLACDAGLSIAAVGDGGGQAAAGAGRRVVAPALRRALELRDGGCTHPGCDIPARWCDAHHIAHWADGGRTEAANLRLLCRRHHRQAHDHQPYPRRQ